MKTGIITHYYKSENYGGNLQAYALCKSIEKEGIPVEQISFNRKRKFRILSWMKQNLLKLKEYRHLKTKIVLKKRSKAIKKFNQSIPHSKEYTPKNIASCLENYDAFITGSDQVWHPMAVCDEYLLSFVPKEKVKISYAASIATDTLEKNVQERYKKELLSFDGISVREEKSVQMLNELGFDSVECTLDPTLLLEKEDWLKIIEKTEIKEKYLFCYFLGAGKKERELASQFAKEKNLKIVTLPYLNGKYRVEDKHFGDYKLYDVGPDKLLSLINGADYIFTDSFHATVFSLIFEKQFFVFQRQGYKSMSSRIYSLINTFETQERFCDTEEKECIEYIKTLTKIDYSRSFKKFGEKKKESIQYLKRYLVEK